MAGGGFDIKFFELHLYVRSFNVVTDQDLKEHEN